MTRIINLYKERGETPLERIERYKTEHPELAEDKFTYAGRLDPMAEGVLLVLQSPTQGEKERYLDLDKWYEVSILFGVGTDTYDPLGIITECSATRTKQISIHPHNFITEVIGLVGTREEEYPPYSSQPVGGKPLFEWAREGRLHEIVIPKHVVTINSAECVRMTHITGEEVLADVLAGIDLVQGDFRQSQIKAIWERTIGPLYNVQFPVATLRIHVESGAYMRMIAKRLGDAMNTPAIALHIKRTRVGRFDQDTAEQ